MSTTPVEKSNIDGSVAGGSGGALLVLFSQSISLDGKLEQLLLYLAPFFGVGISAIWKWSKAQVNEAMNDKKLDEYISNCRTIIRESLLDPNISEGQKNKFKRKYDCLHEFRINFHLGKLKSIQSQRDFHTIVAALDKAIEEAETEDVVQKQ